MLYSSRAWPRNSVNRAGSAPNFSRGGPALPHAVLSIFTAALCADVPHGNDCIDLPSPKLRTGTALLDADRADLYLESIIFENDAVVVVSLRMDYSAEI